MLLHKLKFLALTLLFLGAVAIGAGYWNHVSAMKDEPGKAPAGPQPKIAAKPDDAPAPGRMFVVGRVLDPQGKPMAGVPVDIVGRSRERFLAVQWPFQFPAPARPRRDRRRWPLPIGCVEDLIRTVLRGPCPGFGPRLRTRLGSAQCRRRTAGRRGPPPTRATHPWQAG